VSGLEVELGLEDTSTSTEFELVPCLLRRLMVRRRALPRWLGGSLKPTRVRRSRGIGYALHQK
jgi:hypothetical protein